MSAELAANALQRMRGALRGLGIAARDGVGERGAEATYRRLELAHETGEQVVPADARLDGADLRDRLVVKQRGYHCSSPPARTPSRPSAAMVGEKPLPETTFTPF